MKDLSEYNLEELICEVEEGLAKRYGRIKQERRSLLNLFIGLSGSAIILSISMLNNIAPLKVCLWLVITAWFFFLLSILLSIIILVKMTVRSIIYYSLLKNEFNEIDRESFKNKFKVKEFYKFRKLKVLNKKLKRDSEKILEKRLESNDSCMETYDIIGDKIKDKLKESSKKIIEEELNVKGNHIPHYQDNHIPHLQR